MMGNLKKAIKHPGKAVYVLRERFLYRYAQVYNQLHGRPTLPSKPSGHPAFEKVRQYALRRSDISDHLPLLFAETVRLHPRLIVELGVRGGASTFAFEQAARLTKASIVSVDIEDCSQVIDYPGWHFVKQDDVAFAADFPGWCRTRDLPTAIDVLFIDTSHLLEHTRQEIASWFPFLADHALVFFHDTNQQLVFSRHDGSIGVGWDNERGVIAALEEYFDQTFNETVDFVHVGPDWIIRHYARSNGMTILEKWHPPISV